MQDVREVNNVVEKVLTTQDVDVVESSYHAGR